MLVLGADDLHRRQHHRPVPHRADRARRRHRLLPPPRLAMARGASARPKQRGRRHRRDEDRRPRRPSPPASPSPSACSRCSSSPCPRCAAWASPGSLIPLVSVAAVLTLLPALLSSIGPRVDYPRIRKEGTASRGWSAWARRIVRHRAVAATVALVLLGLAHHPRLRLRDRARPELESLARSGPSLRGAAHPDRRRRRHRGPDAHRGPGARRRRAGGGRCRAWRRRGPAGRVGTISGRPGRRRRPADQRHREQRRLAVVDDVRAAVEPVIERRRRRHRARPGDRGLLQRGLRQVPLRAGPDRPDHLLLLVRTFRSRCCRSRPCCST